MNKIDTTDMSVEELQAKVVSLKQELFNLRFQKATGRLENTASISIARKNIARCLGALTKKAGKAS